jgi:hypothetical protein
MACEVRNPNNPRQFRVFGFVSSKSANPASRHA